MAGSSKYLQIRYNRSRDSPLFHIRSQALALIQVRVTGEERVA